MMPLVVGHKDVVLALLGVSAGLVGLVLVFLGFLIAAFQSFDATTPKTVLDRYRRAGVAVLVAFGIGVLCVVAATAWLVDLGNNRFLYLATVWLFAAQIAAVLGATVWTVRRLMWAD